MNQKILFYSDNAPLGGVQQFNHSIICGLARHGYEVTSVQLNQPDLFVEEQSRLGVMHYWLDAEFLSGYSRSFTDLHTPENIMLKVKPDLIFFSDGWPLGNFAAKQTALKLSVPYLITVGYVDSACAKVERGDGMRYRDAVHFQYAMAESIFAVSQENLDLLHTDFNVPKLRSKVIYYGRPELFFMPLDLRKRAAIRKEFNIPDDAVVCLTSARFAYVKGYDLQIEMLNQLRLRDVWDKLHFIWAGSGIEGESVENEIRQAINSSGLDDKVHFLGERNDIPNLLDASDIYLLPSRAEGMPLAIMEAMAKGLPVVASAVSGIPEELHDTGKLLPDPKINMIATISEMVATLELWVKNPVLRSEIGVACRHRAEILFKEELMINSYLDVVKITLDTRLSVQSKEADVILSKTELDNTKRSMIYLSQVWYAWKQHKEGNLEQMRTTLVYSMNFSPFLRFETLSDWLEKFSLYYRQSNIFFSSYELCNSMEWKLLIKDITSQSPNLEISS